MGVEMGMDTSTVLDPPPEATSEPQLKRELGVGDLTLFAITCIVSARWLPIAAHAGPGSVTLWLLAAAFFVVPLTVSVAALVAKYPEAGGLYLWARRDFGAWHGFVCFWVYWIGIAFLFPTATLLYAKVAFSLLGPSYSNLGENRYYLLTVALVLMWVGLGANIVGLKVGKWAENLGALATGAVGLLLVVVAWMVWTRRGTATAMHIVPKWDWRTVSFWAAIAYATSGMEGPGMMAGEIRDPERTMRRAGWAAAGFAALFYVTATIALVIVLPPERISEMNGFAEIADSAGLLLGAAWLSPLLAILVLASGVGLIGGIGAATSRMPFVAGVDRLLPKAFGKVHPRWGTPHVSILALGIAATFLLIAYQLGDSMRAAFDELVSLMVLTGFLPYLYIFGSAWKAGKRLSAISGIAVTLLALVCSLVPPGEITNVWLFEGKLAAGTLAVVVSAWLVYRRRKIIMKPSPLPPSLGVSDR
jgi:amino acid transporter